MRDEPRGELGASATGPDQCRYHTAWGKGLNFDGPECDEVRRFFLENALRWQTEFHVDGLRLDAAHAISEFSALPFKGNGFPARGLSSGDLDLTLEPKSPVLRQRKED